MKILYIHQYYATPESSGGVRSYHISKGLVARGYEVEIISSSAFVPKHWELEKGWNTRFVEGVKVNILKLPYSNKVGFLRRVWLFLFFSYKSTLKALNIKCDVVFATSTPLTIAIPGVLASKRHKVPLVFEVRDLWPDIPIALKIINSRLIIYLAKSLEKWAYKNAKRVVALSPGMAEGVVRAGYSKNFVVTIPNASDTELFQVSKEKGEQYRAQYSWLDDRILAIYTGTFGKVNNLSYLVDVASFSLDSELDICFVLIGDGAEKGHLIQLAKEKGVLDRNLFILPPVPKSDLPAILSASDICISTVLPVEELWHNSANKFFDALAASRPVAINHYGWQADILKSNGVGIIMNPDNPSEGASALACALSDVDWVTRARKEARRLASSVYSHDIMVAKVEEVIMSAVTL